jgi:hypothetical protein
MESTMLEGRGRARRRLGEAQDADEGEMFSFVWMVSIFSPFHLCHADGDRVFKAELASHDNLWLSQSITASIAVVEELSSEDAAEIEERVTTRKVKRAKQLLESASTKSLLRSSRPPLALVA